MPLLSAPCRPCPHKAFFVMSSALTFTHMRRQMSNTELVARAASSKLAKRVRTARGRRSGHGGGVVAHRRCDHSSAVQHRQGRQGRQETAMACSTMDRRCDHTHALGSWKRDGNPPSGSGGSGANTPEPPMAALCMWHGKAGQRSVRAVWATGVAR